MSQCDYTANRLRTLLEDLTAWEVEISGYELTNALI